MSSCPDLKRFLKPFGIKRQIFWTPILQLAEICHSYYDAHTGLTVGNTCVWIRPPWTHASSSPYDNIGRRRWSLRTMSADIPSIQRRYHSKSESLPLKRSLAPHTRTAAWQSLVPWIFRHRAVWRICSVNKPEMCIRDRLLNMRKLTLTRRAPGCPEIQKNNLSPVIAKGYLFSCLLYTSRCV